MSGEEGQVHDLVSYNAALRLWVADEETPLADRVEHAREVLSTGVALDLVDQLRVRAAATG